MAELMLQNPRPCIVCKSPDVVGAGTWIADAKRALAVGATNTGRIFAFCLCDEHSEATDENEKLTIQAIVRAIRNGNSREV
jgi:hypothetical protein